MGGIKMDEKEYGLREGSGWMRKGMGGVMTDEKGYCRCQDG